MSGVKYLVFFFSLVLR